MSKHLFRIGLFIVLLGAFSNCKIGSPYPTDVQRALDLAGDNRVELEKVLDHYSNDPADSLKLRAAVFLIENMPGHYTYAGEKLDDYIAQLDSLYPDMPYTVKRPAYSIPFRDKEFTAKLTKVYDIDVLTAEFLIDHIDNRIECLDNVPWLRGVTFADFCEYVLPYRSVEEPLTGWNDTTRYTWKSVIGQLYHYTDLPHNLENAMSLQKSVTANKDDIYLQDMETPSGLYTFDCIDKSYYDIHCFRSAGVASAVDFIPHWPTRNGQHYWPVVIDPERINSNLSETLNPRTAKVFRRTYSPNPIPEPKDGSEFVPELFRDPFNRDVTSHYVNVTDIRIAPEIRKGDQPQYLYLCVFNNLEWHPTAWAEIKKGKAQFDDLGVNLVFLPVYYRENQRVQAGYPFHVSADGKITAFIPDTTRREQMRFTRKYPLTYSKTQWTRNLLDVCFEGAADTTFLSSDTVHIVRTTSPDLNWVTIPVDPAKSYRYWRASKSGRQVNFGELIFLDFQGKQIMGRIMSKTIEEKAGDAFDGDILTYNRSHSWIGMDFGRPVSLSAIRYISRTDGNGIFPGDLYELLYHGSNGWIQVDMDEAQTPEINFTDVPAGALYWLRNLTEGQEERIFTYQNGHREFW